MSSVAYALYTYLQRQPDGSNIVMEDLTRVLRASKTAIRAAFEELAAKRLLSYSQEA